MAQAKFLKKQDLVAWLDELAGTRRVLAPTRDEDAVVFKSHAKGAEPELDRQATQPPKKAIFAPSEQILRYVYTKDPEDPGKVKVSVDETIEPTPTVVVGGRPCDARGFLVFDRVYRSARSTDVYYDAKRDVTAFVTLACPTTSSTCFCHAVDSHPADTTGSDVLMTPVDDGFVLEPVTDKGEELLNVGPLQDANDAKLAEAKKVHEEAAQALPEAPNFEGAPEKLLTHFDDMEFWEDVSNKCISCGACTYLCPTCYCFNITDESRGKEGVRLRSWDNCMSYQFTMEASGHNPRPTKAHRLKNRVGHKFSYYPTLHEGVIACCGCGRCIKSCPVGVDIREIVEKAVASEPAPNEA
jgi:ferredoxin